jgi:hypothetical protein
LVSGSRWKRPGAGRLGIEVDDVALARDPLADLQPALHRAADLDDLAGELVAHDHRDRDRLGGPLVPLPDVQVGAADGGAAHADQHVLWARLRHRRLDLPEALLRLGLGQRDHLVPHFRASQSSRARAKAWKSKSRRVGRAAIVHRPDPRAGLRRPA